MFGAQQTERHTVIFRCDRTYAQCNTVHLLFCRKALISHSNHYLCPCVGKLNGMMSSFHTERYKNQRRVDKLTRYNKSILDPGPPAVHKHNVNSNRKALFGLFILPPRQQVVRLTSRDPGALCLMEEGTAFPLCSEIWITTLY